MYTTFFRVEKEVYFTIYALKKNCLLPFAKWSDALHWLAHSGRGFSVGDEEHDRLVLLQSCFHLFQSERNARLLDNLADVRTCNK